MNRLKNLSDFTDTENYYSSKHYPFVYSDGIKYLAENGKAYWLIDAIASWQGDPIIKDDQDLNRIQFWKLKVNPDKSAILVCERDSYDIVCEQKIPLTDFPLSEVILYLCGMGINRGVLILPSEH